MSQVLNAYVQLRYRWMKVSDDTGTLVPVKDKNYLYLEPYYDTKEEAHRALCIFEGAEEEGEDFFGTGQDYVLVQVCQVRGVK